MPTSDTIRRASIPPGRLRDVVETSLPSRLDRLPWSRFHWLVVTGLGITWVLDGLEVTLAGAVAGALRDSPVLHFSEAEIGRAASVYLAGAVIGALFFGWLTDRLGRKKLFFVTLGVYVLATAGSAFAWDFRSFAVLRLLTGAGIGGEYAAINSAIQELVPARYRGRTDLAINGSYWLGAAAGAAGTVVLLDPARFAPDLGWRLAFGIGAVLGASILLLRGLLPESPRWLMLKGRLDEAERIVGEIEARVGAPAGSLEPPKMLRIATRTSTGFADLAVSLFKLYPKRAALGLILMASQAFCYNAIFFTYALVLAKFFGVASDAVGLYLLPFALANFAGPLLLGPLFDIRGRRVMIAGTFAIAGVLLAATAALFLRGQLNAVSLTVAWSAVFFFASAAASSAYLTVSESFPLEVRALAIATFYALGTAIGGVAAPWLFGVLIASGEPGAIASGYALGAVLMIVAAIAEAWLGVDAERRSLEDVAAPLSASP